MRKRNLVAISAISAGISAAGTYLLQNKPARDKLVNFVRIKMDGGGIDEDQFPIEKAGHPGPDNMADNEMVSEGAQFGVQYYNHARE